MRKSLSELLNSVYVSSCPHQWYDLYDAYMDAFEQEGAFFLTDEFICASDAEMHCLGSKLDVALAAAKEISKLPDLCAYAYLLYASMKDRSSFDMYSMHIKLPEPPAELESRLAFDMISLYPVLAHLPQGYQSLLEHSVPKDVVFATMRNIEESMLVYAYRFDREGFNPYFRWIQHYMVGDILTIGRLQFEMKPKFTGGVKVYENNGSYQILMHDRMLHKSGHILGSCNMAYSDGAYYAAVKEYEDVVEGYPVQENGLASDEKVTLPKSGWKLVLADGESVLSVHIPRGKGLTKDACDAAYKRAAEIVSTCYPNFHYKAFVCFSWLMSTQLPQYMKPDANIAVFQSRYMRFPIHSMGQAVFSFLYPKPVPSLEALPENTGLERGVKALYLAGGCIYEAGGVFFMK